MRRLAPCLLLAALVLVCPAFDTLATRVAHADGKKKAPSKPPPPNAAKAKDKGKQKNKKDKKFATDTILHSWGGLPAVRGGTAKIKATVYFKDVAGKSRPVPAGQTVELLVERDIGSQRFEVVAKAKTNANGQVAWDWKVGKNYPSGEHAIKARLPAQGKLLKSESRSTRITVKKR